MTTKDEEAAPLWCSSRLALTIVAFFGFVNLYALRVNMSVAIVCMTRDARANVNVTAGGCGNGTGEANVIATKGNGIGGVDAMVTMGNKSHCIQPMNEQEADKFDWDKKTQGLILGSFFWGYTVTQLPGGWLAGRYGGKHVFGWSMFVCAVATLLTPAAARVHEGLLLAIRVIAGLGQGVVWPSMQDLFAHWVPPLERSKLSGFVYAGAQVGNVLAFPLCGLLCVYGFDGGWASIFYILGGLGVLWFVAWMYIVYDSPVQHPRISARERDYIVNSLRSDIDVAKKSISTPWRKIFTSMPVWAIIVTHMCCNWGTYTFLTNIPSYMEDVLKFNIKQAGFLSALPYIGFWAMTNVSGQVADFLRRRGLASTTTTRKLFNSLGSFVPALFVVLTGYMADQAGVAVTLLTIGVAMSGCQYGSGFIVNPVDIAPRYAGIIFGISNTTGTLGGFLAPIAIGYITSEKTREQWRIVFFIAAAIYTLGAIFYIVFGSGELQSWAADEISEDIPEVEVMTDSHNSRDNDVNRRKQNEEKV